MDPFKDESSLFLFPWCFIRYIAYGDILFLCFSLLREIVFNVLSLYCTLLSCYDYFKKEKLFKNNTVNCRPCKLKY